MAVMGSVTQHGMGHSSFHFFLSFPPPLPGPQPQEDRPPVLGYGGPCSQRRDEEKEKAEGGIHGDLTCSRPSSVCWTTNTHASPPLNYRAHR